MVSGSVGFAYEHVTVHLGDDPDVLQARVMQFRTLARAAGRRGQGTDLFAEQAEAGAAWASAAAYLVDAERSGLGAERADGVAWGFSVPGRDLAEQAAFVYHLARAGERGLSAAAKRRVLRRLATRHWQWVVCTVVPLVDLACGMRGWAEAAEMAVLAYGVFAWTINGAVELRLRARLREPFHTTPVIA